MIDALPVRMEGRALDLNGVSETAPLLPLQYISLRWAKFRDFALLQNKLS
jgi:hypothetical protein